MIKRSNVVVEETNKMSDKVKVVGLNVKCGSCVYYNRSAIFSDGEKLTSCSKMGRLPVSLPCSSYSVDPYAIDFKDRPVAMKALKEFFAECTSNNDLKTAAALLLRENVTRKYGFHLGQQIYLKAFEGDYISNWYAATVIYADSNYVYCQGLNGSRWQVYHDSIVLPKNFNKIKTGLKSRRRLIDPRWELISGTELPDKEKLKLENYKPQTIPPSIKMAESLGSQQKKGCKLDTKKVKKSKKKGNISVFSVRAKG